VLDAKETLEDPAFQGAEWDQLRGSAGLFAGMHDMWDTHMAIQLDARPDGYLIGTGVRIATGEASNLRFSASPPATRYASTTAPSEHVPPAMASNEAVTLEVHAEVRPGAGTVIGVKWDFDASGTNPFAHDVDGSAAEIDLVTTYAFERPRTNFPTALVESHREGYVHAVTRRIPNLASARVVET
jgi:hypothetical protein